MYPKGALTHHLLKQAVAALPLAGHVRSPRGIAAPAGAAGQGCISAKLSALSTQSAQGFPFGKPLFMGWYIATPSRRLPVSTLPRTNPSDMFRSLTQIQGWTKSFRPCWWCVAFHDALSETRVPCFGPVDKSAIGYSMELRPMALRVLRRLTPGCFRVVRSFTIRFRFNAVAERRQCS